MIKFKKSEIEKVAEKITFDSELFGDETMMVIAQEEIMNAMQIRKMLNNIKADFIGMGRPWHENDNSVIELLMSIYYQTAEIDWEEIKWLFITYLQKGILDFPTAKKMATKRLSA